MVAIATNALSMWWQSCVSMCGVGGGVTFWAGARVVTKAVESGVESCDALRRTWI